MRGMHRMKRDASRQLARYPAHRGDRAPSRLVSCRSCTLAVQWQAHGDTCALADPAADREFAAVQPHQALDDGEPQPGPAVAPVERGTRLEVRLADARQILIADSDAVILDHE